MRFALTGFARCLRTPRTVLVTATAACGGATTSLPEATTAAEMTPEAGELALEAAEITPVSPVQGRLHVLAEPGADTSLAPVVVLLQRIARSDRPAPANRVVRVVSTSDRFDPPFTAVGARDTVILVNQGRLRHRLFSPDLDADLRSEVVIPVAPGGEYASLDFRVQGPKRLYCSLHPDEVFSIFVSGTPFYDITERDGSYLIPDVPVGRYRLTIWSEVVSGFVRYISVDAGQRNVENIWIDSKLLSR
ncbi:MAG: carboxypeptidase regulatory-like domain-containing protein [Gemmatimonadota bacterium]|nr:MAG: carboxypeptidase regulatory-like domain-containing protein [Gemmatimonadota bacterium]